MPIISTICILGAYAAVFGTMLLARLDYRNARRVEDWDAR